MRITDTDRRALHNNMASVASVRTISTVCLLSYLCVLVRACSEEFLDLVRVCHERVQDGLPRLHTGPLLMVDDFDKLEAYCRLNVTSHVSECLTELYECPVRAEMRSRCNLASLHPEVLVRRLVLSCAMIDVLKDEIDCVNMQTCAMKRCLATVARQPDPMTLAILNPPMSGNKCNWLDRVKMCYNLHVRTACSDVIAEYMVSMLDTYKPPSCVSQHQSETHDSENGAQHTVISSHLPICIVPIILCAILDL